MRKMLLSMALLALVAAPAMAEKYNSKISIGQKAPDFSGIPAYDAAAKQDTSLTLGDIKEDVVVVFFSGNHCPMVQQYEDRIVEFVNSVKGKSVKVVGIAVGDIDEDRLPGIKKYTADKGSNYIYGYDESQVIGKAYGAVKTPEFFVLDKDRKIAYAGALDDNPVENKVKTNYVKDAVAALLAGKAPAVATSRAVGCGIHYTK